MTSSDLESDGSALAGPFHDVFCVEVTTAIGRCPACDQVLLRLVQGSGRAWLDLRGLAYLQVPVPDET